MQRLADLEAYNLKGCLTLELKFTNHCSQRQILRPFCTLSRHLGSTLRSRSKGDGLRLVPKSNLGTLGGLLAPICGQQIVLLVLSYPPSIDPYVQVDNGWKGDVEVIKLLGHEDGGPTTGGGSQKPGSRPPRGMHLDLGALQMGNPVAEPTEIQARRTKFAFFEKHCSRVAEHVYLGSDVVARSREILRESGITHVLNCVGFVCPEYFAGELVYKTLWLQVRAYSHWGYSCLRRFLRASLHWLLSWSWLTLSGKLRFQPVQRFLNP